MPISLESFPYFLPSKNAFLHAILPMITYKTSETYYEFWYIDTLKLHYCHWPYNFDIS